MKTELEAVVPVGEQWSVHESRIPGYERTISVVDTTNLSICAVTGAGSMNPRVLEKARAHARLIAAAPALHEALTMLLDTETNLGGVSAITLLDAIDKAHAALALVDGPQRETK